MFYHNENTQNNKAERKGTIVGRPTIINGQVVVTAEQDRLYQLAAKRNKVKSFINNNVVDYKTYRQASKKIKEFAQEDVSELDVLELSTGLKEKGTEVLKSIETKMEEINAVIEDLRANCYTEDTEELNKLHVHVEHRILEIIAQMTATKDTNKRKIGSFVHNADRVQALALLKISMIPQYADLFNTAQKTQLLEKSKSDAQIKHEQAVENAVKKQGTKLGELYRECFMFRQVLKRA